MFTRPNPPKPPFVSTIHSTSYCRYIPIVSHWRHTAATSRDTKRTGRSNRHEDTDTREGTLSFVLDTASTVKSRTRCFLGKTLSP